ncbi:FecR family protein [uncultured Draconibacterium sp.]|uniref:FecR family protein n=1 Tax=uncultured Draconibacterium sp. TaxID=1573823 RepID=UPI0025F9EBA2|nr:FecR family protein [uncultured Draconibacterium sp.]
MNKELLIKYLNNQCSPEEFELVTAWFKNEVINKEGKKWSFENWKEFNPIIENKDDERYSFLLDKIHHKINLNKTEKKEGLSIHKIPYWLTSVAAVLVFALLFGNIFFFHKAKQYDVAEQLQTILTPPGAKTNITLPDGSLVWLNSGSTLSYPLKFNKDRSVSLIGEAYFEVEKDDMPFIVNTNYGDVEVKGTSFDVKAYIDDDAFETTLVEGIVVFKENGAENGVTLKPGEQIAKDSNGYTIKQVETKYFTCWKDGKLLIKNEPFPSFIKKLERWYNIKIECSDPWLEEMRYTGTIEMESISEVMELITKAAPVVYNYNPDTRTYTIKVKK